MRFQKSYVLLAVLALTLGACGDPDAADASQGGPGTAATAPASGADATELCDFLRSDIPRPREVGSEVGRLAQLTVHPYAWGEEQKIEGKMDVEALTKVSCPRRPDRGAGPHR